MTNHNVKAGTGVPDASSTVPSNGAADALALQPGTGGAAQPPPCEPSHFIEGRSNEVRPERAKTQPPALAAEGDRGRLLPGFWPWPALTLLRIPDRRSLRIGSETTKADVEVVPDVGALPRPAPPPTRSAQPGPTRSPPPSRPSLPKLRPLGRSRFASTMIRAHLTDSAASRFARHRSEVAINVEIVAYSVPVNVPDLWAVDSDNTHVNSKASLRRHLNLLVDHRRSSSTAVADLRGANGEAVTSPSGRFKSESWPVSNQSPAGLRRNSQLWRLRFTFRQLATLRIDRRHAKRGLSKMSR